MILNDLCLLGISSNRTKAYLQNMISHNLIPAKVIILKNDTDDLKPGQLDTDRINNKEFKERQIINYNNFSFCPEEPLLETIEKNNISYDILNTVDINSSEVFNALKSTSQEIILYSGPGGAILKHHLFTINKKYLHVHPGYLPDFRGSTTVYYSIIEEKQVGASSLFLNEKIDQGPVLHREKFKLPEQDIDLDYVYDPMIRAQVLIKTLNKIYLEQMDDYYIQEPDKGETYFIIHPVLKHIAFLIAGK